ncbi:MAG: hypothetical protein C4535_00205 [Comamonadaceae bacterium]|nr:MAG: hypothetical protein C4535_00205 [Comamonadaceae bacterium]
MSNGRFVLVSLMALALLALTAQLFIDFTTENIASACIVFVSSMAILLYLLWTPAIKTHPLSTFAIFGFCMTTQLGALLGQTALLTSLANNLRQPMETFATLAGFQAVAMLAHTGYRWLLNPPGREGQSPPRQLLDKLGLYRVPGTGALWLMGYVGMLAFLIGSAREGTFGKVLQGMTFLTWAPFLIPMYLLQLGERYCNARRQYPHLVFFAGLVVLLGLAANARSIIFSGFVSIALFALLMVLRNADPVSPKRVLRLGLLGLVLAALAIPVSDLATAMVVARKVRGSVSAVQMVTETFHYLGQPEALEGERQRVRDEALNKYDEFYLANPLLARLVETKFHDNSLYFVSLFSSSDSVRLAETTGDMLWSILPDPVLKALSVDVDKRDLKFSMGDYLSHLGQGGPLGGYRTGSMLAQGVALLGVGFAALYFLCCLLVFAVIDLLSYRPRGGPVLLSAMGMLMVWELFLNGITADSLHAWLGLVIRTLPQALFFFLLLAGVARFSGWLFSGSPSRGFRDRAPQPQR